jgi:hypothetical protein
MVVELAAITVVNSIVHATLSNAVVLVVQWEVVEFLLSLKHTFPLPRGQRAHCLCAVS